MEVARQTPGEWGGGLVLSRQPIRVEAGHEGSTDGCLVLADDRLVAVLVRCSPANTTTSGQWHLGAGFGRLAGPEKPAFANLDTAIDWIAQRLSRSILSS